MKYENYDTVRIADDLSSFDFVSTGKNGDIPKRIIFMPTHLPEVFILAFGSITDNEEVDDYAISDNGDRNKTLATIAVAVDLYTRCYPDRMIYFRGSTKERTRLYRMAVGINLEELCRTFDIYAEVDQHDDFVPFRKNMEINAFLVKRKVQ
ncbi:MAG TPA: hypothetical protein VL832_14575 [Puia sp.]|jgi:hypothetical protein|nr:hypothetical protein [Puia sp.]